MGFLKNPTSAVSGQMEKWRRKPAASIRLVQADSHAPSSTCSPVATYSRITHYPSAHTDVVLCCPEPLPSGETHFCRGESS